MVCQEVYIYMPKEFELQKRLDIFLHSNYATLLSALYCSGLMQIFEICNKHSAHQKFLSGPLHM